MCDSVPLLCWPECWKRMSGVGREWGGILSRSSLSPYSLSNSLFSQHFVGTCRIQALQHQETPEMKHTILHRCSSCIIQKNFCLKSAFLQPDNCSETHKLYYFRLKSMVWCVWILTSYPGKILSCRNFIELHFKGADHSILLYWNEFWTP